MRHKVHENRPLHRGEALFKSTCLQNCPLHLRVLLIDQRNLLLECLHRKDIFAKAHTVVVGTRLEYLVNLKVVLANVVLNLALGEPI